VQGLGDDAKPLIFSVNAFWVGGSVGELGLGSGEAAPHGVQDIVLQNYVARSAIVLTPR